MQFDVNEIAAQAVVSMILIGGAWLMKLRRDVNKLWTRQRMLEDAINKPRSK